MDQAADLPVPQRVKALWDAAVFYVHLRENEVARVLDQLKDLLHQAHYQRNVYSAQYVPQAPMGVSGWLHSPLLGQQADRDARFHPYLQRGEAYDLVADMAADRPLEERQGATAGERATSFAMLYDNAGWHIHIDVQEPDVQEIMMAGGKGGSSLELFLSPGLEAGVYHQIMIRLGTGDVDIYNWGSPHRAYRHLETGPGGVREESVPMEDRWAVVIFIPWHFFHDRLPFVQGNDDAWRFSIIRFGRSGRPGAGARSGDTVMRFHWFPLLPLLFVGVATAATAATTTLGPAQLLEGPSRGVEQVTTPDGPAIEITSQSRGVSSVHIPAEPGRRYQLTLIAHTNSHLTVEQNDRAVFLIRMGNSRESPFYQVAFLDDQGKTIKRYGYDGAQGFIATSQPYRYATVFYTPPQTAAVRLQLRPGANNSLFVSEVTLSEAPQDGTVNLNPDFQLGELNYAGWRPRREGHLYREPDGRVVLHPGYYAKSRVFPLEGGAAYEVIAKGQGGGLSLVYINENGKRLHTVSW